MTKKTLNNQLAVRPHVSQGIQTEVRSGFASVSHHTGIVPLELLIDAQLNSGEVIKAGAKIFFRESDLGTLVWAKSPAHFKSGDTKMECILAPLDRVVMVEQV